jgi:thioredoxin-like negative regulator of GroEL
MARFRESVQNGVDFLNAGRFREAAGELSIAAGIQPENVEVLRFLSTAQARSGEYERAHRVLKQAVELVTSFVAWNRLRVDQGLTVKRAQATMELSVLALLRELVYESAKPS